REIGRNTRATSTRRIGRFRIAVLVFVLEKPRPGDSMRRHVWLLCAPVLAGCRSAPADDPAAQDAFWFALQSLCGSAYEGQLVQGSPADSVFTGKVLVMHAHDCSDAEVSVAFNVGDDRSRTWVFTRTPDGLRLK